MYNIKKIAFFSLMALSTGSNQVAALGLGSLDVQSNLDQAFDGAITLNVAPGDDVDTITAQIASLEDFNSFNIDYPSYLTNMTILLDRSGPEPVLKISSNGVVINEPFIHFLVKVDWSGGSFLREYTALIDPPVYASETPNTVAEPRVVGNDQSFQNIPTAPTSSPSTVVGSNNIQAQTFIPSSSNAQYGPVARGESLSIIARELQQQFPTLSIYQIMQVLYEQNRSAFIDENINGLLEGSILNVADINVIRSVDVEESREFFRNQVARWNPSSLNSNDDSTIRVGQDDYVDNEDALFAGDSEGASTSSAEDQDVTFQVGSSSDTDSFVSAAQGDSREGEIIALQQEVTDLEASLSSSSLENQELRERISILEGQLADVNRLIGLNIEDAELANLESTLANQNNAATDNILEQTEDLIGEGSDLAGSALDTVVDGLDVAVDGVDDVIGDLGTTVDGIADDIGSSIEEVVESVVVEEPIAPPAVVTLSSEPSLFEKLSGSLWKILPIALAALGGLFWWRRRQSDEEFEVSMMSIESHDSVTLADSSTSVDTEEVSVKPLSVETEPKLDVNSVDTTVDATSKDETSFLTVYSDSDAVVQADEVDPIAEADVYIAYGRNEQAEEVLLDGMKNQPERVDIKFKLLALYHKTSNSPAFERVAEELYAQKDSAEPEMWRDVSIMGNELLPNNPMFELSSGEMFAATDGSVSNLAADESNSNEIEKESSMSVNLTNFEEGASELDNVSISSLDPSTSDDVVEFEPESTEESEVTIEESSSTASLVREVSDLVIDADYDESRTQYELAKVFVDLGDEDGARKILTEIIDNKDNPKDVLKDAEELLKTMG